MKYAMCDNVNQASSCIKGAGTILGMESAQ